MVIKLAIELYLLQTSTYGTPRYIFGVAGRFDICWGTLKQPKIVSKIPCLTFAKPWSF